MASPQTFVSLQGMTADINAQHLFFEGKFQFLRVFAHIGHPDLVVFFVFLICYVKERHLTCHVVLLGALQVIKDSDVDAHQLFSGAFQTIQSTRLDEVFDCPAVDVLFLGSHAGQEVADILEGSAQAPFVDQGIDHRTSDSLDGSQRVADPA